MPASLRGRKEFSVIVTTTPKLLVPERSYACVFTADVDIYIGSAGSTTGTWLRVPVDLGFVDDLTQDPYYARTLTGSGTANGWYI